MRSCCSNRSPGPEPRGVPRRPDCMAGRRPPEASGLVPSTRRSVRWACRSSSSLRFEVSAPRSHPERPSYGRFPESPSGFRHGLFDSSDSMSYGRVRIPDPDFENSPYGKETRLRTKLNPRVESTVRAPMHPSSRSRTLVRRKVYARQGWREESSPWNAAGIGRRCTGPGGSAASSRSPRSPAPTERRR